MGYDLITSNIHKDNIQFIIVQSILLMWTLGLQLLCSCILSAYAGTDSNNDNRYEDPVLYYYGLEESERSLPLCAARQACSALLARAWRAPALVRLCRCARRRRCDAPMQNHSRLEINNQAFLQFCEPVSSWPQCEYGATPLAVQMTYDRLDPDELEELHHKNIQLVPPKILFTCRCQEPNYWKLNLSTEYENTKTYQCSSLPPCSSGQFCGNVNNDLYSLYQTCLCPKHHICVHTGGIPHHDITELLYRGKGWKANCQRTDDFSYEDYYE